MTIVAPWWLWGPKQPLDSWDGPALLKVHHCFFLLHSRCCQKTPYTAAHTEEDKEIPSEKQSSGPLMEE